MRFNTFTFNLFLSFVHAPSPPSSIASFFLWPFIPTLILNNEQFNKKYLPQTMQLYLSSLHSFYHSQLHYALCSLHLFGYKKNIFKIELQIN